MSRALSQAGRALMSAAALLLLLGCGGDREDNEGRLLLDRVERLEHNDPAERSRRVGELAAMPLSTPDLLTVRDACVTMHTALMTADRSTAEARTALGALEALSPAAQKAPGAGDEMAGALRRSEIALQAVRDSQSDCQDGITGLRVRYGH